MLCIMVDMFSGALLDTPTRVLMGRGVCWALLDSPATGFTCVGCCGALLDYPTQVLTGRRACGVPRQVTSFTYVSMDSLAAKHF